MRRHRLLVVALLATGLSAPGGAGERSAAPTLDTKAMVLQLRDLPSGFRLAQGHYVSNAQLVASTTTNKDYRRLGRLIGYSTDYTAVGVEGVTAVSSFASVHRLGSGAHRSLQLSLDVARRQAGFVLEPHSAVTFLGGEACLYLQREEQDGVMVDFYTVAWRNGPVFAEVMGAGRSGTFDPGQVVAFSKKQDARIERLLS